ncbi:hypothetical protein LguiB_031684 [Lonicera macranthoides]
MSANPQPEQEQVEADYTDEEIDLDELERRLERDKMRLKRLKEMNKGKEGGVDAAKQRQSQEHARRKMFPSLPNSQKCFRSFPKLKGKRVRE